MAFEINYAYKALETLDVISAFDRQSILSEIVKHLTHQPMMVSKSRIKKMIQPAVSQFRLRVGDYRVFYDVIEELKEVRVRFILEKGRSETPKEEPS